MEIRAHSDTAKRILEASVKADVTYLDNVPDRSLKDARCTSGCTALHWAAGSNQIDVIEYLVSERLFAVDTLATRKARGRTPMHYACRNGCFEAAKLLVQLGANVNARAKHGVSPFQLAIWQNQMRICVWLVEEHGVDSAQLNDFDCGAVHWIGICPIHRADSVESGSEDATGQGLIPLAKWLARQKNVDFRQRQRQGHTILHKAAWGGHIALIRYVRDEHGCLDEFQDYAGNWAADLADMANTPRHSEVARFLREECSAERANSCATLGVPVGATPLEIRKAYLSKAFELHPDRLRQSRESDTEQPEQLGFDTLRKAYEHLTLENGNGFQANPSHSLNLMIELSQGDVDATNQDADSSTLDESICFKARLVAVLLEYGDRGLDVSNVKKKWRQLWPETPFPDEHESSKDGRKRRGALTSFIQKHAGDVVDIVVPEDGKGSIRVIPKNCTQEQVARRSTLECHC